MSLAGLYNAPKTASDLAFWTHDNADSHILIVNALQKKHQGLKLYTFALDPLPSNDYGNFLLRHQMMHNQMDPLLGIGGNDYTGLDFLNPSDPGTLEYLLRLHANEHIQAHTMLRIGIS